MLSRYEGPISHGGRLLFLLWDGAFLSDGIYYEGEKNKLADRMINYIGLNRRQK